LKILRDAMTNYLKSCDFASKDLHTASSMVMQGIRLLRDHGTEQFKNQCTFHRTRDLQLRLDIVKNAFTELHPVLKTMDSALKGVGTLVQEIQTDIMVGAALESGKMNRLKNLVEDRNTALRECLAHDWKSECEELDTKYYSMTMELKKIDQELVKYIDDLFQVAQTCDVSEMKKDPGLPIEQDELFRLASHISHYSAVKNKDSSVLAACQNLSFYDLLSNDVELEQKSFVDDRSENVEEFIHIHSSVKIMSARLKQNATVAVGEAMWLKKKQEELAIRYESEIANRVQILKDTFAANQFYAEKLLSAVEEIEDATPKMESVIADAESAEIEIETLKAELKIRKKKMKTLSEDKLALLKELQKKRWKIMYNSDAIQLRALLSRHVIVIPELSIFFPTLFPLFGTRAQFVPYKNLEQDYRDISAFSSQELYIYEAFNLEANRKCLLKQQIFENSKEFKSLRKMADLLCKLNSPGIVSLNAVVSSFMGDESSGGLLYLEFDHYQQGTLEDWIISHPDRTHLQIGSIIHGLAKVIQVLQDNHIVHGDLNPKNIFMSDTDTPVVFGFDLAIKLETSEKDDEKTGLTTVQFGRKGYVDPACIRGGTTISFSADLFSLGVILSQLLIGRTLSDPEEVSTGRYPPDAEELLKGLLQHSPEKRWTLRQVMDNAFVQGCLKCSICLEYFLLKQLIACDASIELDQSSHIVCQSCLIKFVEDFCSKDMYFFVKSGGKINCIMPRCKRSFSDVSLFRNLPQNVFESYINVKGRWAELNVASIVEMEALKSIHNELDRLYSLDPKERELFILRKEITELVNLKCPSCGQVFVDFTGCFALTCSRCDARFCGWCLQQSTQKDVHPHVQTCALNKNPGSYYGDIGMWKSSHTERIKRTIEQKIRSLENERLREEICLKIAKDLKDIGIDHLDL
jgi:serine/threonine protein kinase